MNVEAFFKITYGFYIISSSDGEHESGFISNTVMQVTAEPIRLVITSNKLNFTTPLIQKSKVFAISALQQETKLDIISKFGYKSGRDINKFSSFKHIQGEKNIPILTEDTIAWFECEVFQEIDLGTHILFLAKVKNSEVVNENYKPLTYAYYRDVLKMKSSKNAPTYIKPETNINSNIMKDETKKNDIYICEVCGYEYDPAKGDPDSGIAPGTAFEDLPDDWVCPLCGVDKSNFTKK